MIIKIERIKYVKIEGMLSKKSLMNISSCWAGSPLVYSVCDIVGLDYYSTGYTVVSRSTHWGSQPNMN